MLSVSKDSGASKTGLRSMASEDNNGGENSISATSVKSEDVESILLK